MAAGQRRTSAARQHARRRRDRLDLAGRRAAQRTPLNTEAKLLMLTHAFENWRVHAVSLMTDARNERSRAPSCGSARASTACSARRGPRRTARSATPRPSRSSRRSGRRSSRSSRRDSRRTEPAHQRREDMETGTLRLKVGLAEMLKGGVIMDVTNAEQAKIAEDAGAVAVMALERVPSDIRRDGGVARMSPVTKIKEIQKAVIDPGDGQVPHRPLRRGADPRGARRGLHRRVRGADPRRRALPRRQVRLQGALRLRLPRPGRGAAAHRRGRGDDPHQGRGGLGQHRRGGAPHARGDVAASAGSPCSAPRS